VEPEGNSDSTAVTGRRSSRVIVSIPLLISGKREDGTRFESTAEAVVVNKHGGKIQTSEELTAGMQIRIAIVSPYRFQMAKVIREEAAGEFAVELQEAENLWGVYFPPDDWVADPSEAVNAPAEQPDTATAPLIETRTGEGAAAAVSGIANTASAGQEKIGSLVSPLQLSRSGSAAMIRGVSAVRMPFQERCVLLPVDEHHAGIAIRQLVEPGMRVRVILLPSERVENAVIARMSRTRLDGRWKLQLRFGTSLCG
jgi:hypothetical protein